MRYVYPRDIASDAGGELVVTFLDMPEALDAVGCQLVVDITTS